MKLQAQVMCVRNGQVVKLVVYADSENASADLGLTPDTGT
jgi:hypothetical protein